MWEAGDGADRASRPWFTLPPDNGKRDVQGQRRQPVVGVVLLKAYPKASGATDLQIAYLVQRPWSTVQAILGAVPETLDARQRHALKTEIAQQSRAARRRRRFEHIAFLQFRQ